MAKVLLVDDDNTTVMLLKTLLELDGFEIQTVGNGSDVMSLLDNFQPDVVLMDYHLSDMDGVEVLRGIRKHEAYAELPVVMASGLDVSEEAAAAGANMFLIKPFEPDELSGLFHSLIK